MAPKRKSKKTAPAIFVFCEGETEQRYIDLLRQNFRVPIQIVTKVVNTRISQRLIDAHIKNSGYPDVDKVFLFYDGDRPDIVERLYGIRNAEVMMSCPCVELWMLLHFTEHHRSISSDDVVKLLQRHYPSYKKGELQGQIREILLSSWEMAATRAKALTAPSNPSTTAYILPEYLQDLKNTEK